MSGMFRPVTEDWGESSDQFVNHEALVGLLADLAARVGVSYSEADYREVTSVWLEDGRKVLDYIEFDDRFNPASFKDSLKEEGFYFTLRNLEYLIGNMKSLVPEWRKSVGKRGELFFYVD